MILNPAPGGTVVGADQARDIRALDEGTTAGNARGEDSTDLQSSRTGATQVASGAQSVISGGKNNTASNTLSVVAGGTGNANSGNSAAISGGS